MMKYEDYEKLWGKISQLKKRLKKPSYYEYLKREIYFQDYLDLFLQNDIDSITYKRKEINGFQTVWIDGFILEPTEKFTITDHETGLIRLIVDHKYPFENKVFGLVNNIKYILIGEAAPGGNKNISKVDSQQIGEAAPEGGKKYIYKDANSAYMTAPLRASGIDPDKLKSFKRLEKFAEKGYLLLDLIPFAIDFNKHAYLRLQISSNQQLMSCFMEALEDRVSRLANDGFLNPEWDFCFVGPETTSVGIMEFIEKEKKGHFNGKTLAHCDDKMDADDFTYQVSRKDKKTGVTITTTQIKTNYTTHPTPGGDISHISKRARLTTIIGGSGPHSELIQRAFGL
jgi:hypothetical protein